MFVLVCTRRPIVEAITNVCFNEKATFHSPHFYFDLTVEKYVSYIGSTCQFGSGIQRNIFMLIRNRYCRILKRRLKDFKRSYVGFCILTAYSKLVFKDSWLKLKMQELDDAKIKFFSLDCSYQQGGISLPLCSLLGADQKLLQNLEICVYHERFRILNKIV